MTTEEQIRDCFGVVGQIKGVRLLRDNETGRLKGYAFVEYTNGDSVKAAIRLLDKTELNDRVIKVSHASGTGMGPTKALTAEGIIDSMPLHEVWDVLSAIKSMIEEHTAAELLETHPGLMPALTQAQKRLGLVGMNR